MGSPSLLKEAARTKPRSHRSRRRTRGPAPSLKQLPARPHRSAPGDWPKRNSTRTQARNIAQDTQHRPLHARIRDARSDEGLRIDSDVSGHSSPSSCNAISHRSPRYSHIRIAKEARQPNIGRKSTIDSAFSSEFRDIWSSSRGGRAPGWRPEGGTQQVSRTGSVPVPGARYDSALVASKPNWYKHSTRLCRNAIAWVHQHGCATSGWTVPAAIRPTMTRATRTKNPWLAPMPFRDAPRVGLGDEEVRPFDAPPASQARAPCDVRLRRMGGFATDPALPVPRSGRPGPSAPAVRDGSYRFSSVPVSGDRSYGFSSLRPPSSSHPDVSPAPNLRPRCRWMPWRSERSSP